MADKSIGRALRSPAIPPLTQENLVQVVESITNWIQAREGRLGDGLDRAVTLRDIDLLNLADTDSLRRVATGRRSLTSPVTVTPGGVVGPPDDEPPAPTNLRAFGAVSNVIITWRFAAFPAFDYFEVWRAPVDAIGSAVMVLTTSAPVAADQPPSGTTVYYWVRARSIYDRPGPYNALAGTPATLALDPAVLLASLDGQIKMSHLYRELAEPIQSIIGRSDEAAADTTAALVAAHQAARRAKVALLDEARARGTAIGTLQRLVTAGDEQLAAQLVTLTAEVVDARTEALAAVQAEELARATAVSTEATQRLTLATQLRGTYAGNDLVALSSGLLFQERQSRSTVDAAHAGRLDDLEASVDDPATGLLTRAAALESVTTDASSGNGALALRTNVLEARVETPAATLGAPSYNPTYASLVQTQQAFAALDGRASTTYSIRTTISAGGRTMAGGFALMGSSTAAPGTEIEMGVLASRFWVGAPVGSGISDQRFFTIQTTPWYDNGVERPPGMYVDAGLFVKNFTALYATIQQLVADDIVAANISAAKLTVGDGTVGGNLKSTVFVPGEGMVAGTGWLLTPGGNIFGSNVTLWGTINASAGSIGGNIIDSSGVQSPGYVSGVSGWRWNTAGNVEINNVVARGAVYAASGQVGGAIIDASGVQSADYVADTSGWRWDNALGKLFALAGKIGGWTIDALSLRIGATGWLTGVGIWGGLHSGVAKAFIGNPAGPHAKWDGTDLVINTPTFETFTAAIPGGAVGGATTRTVVVTGGKSPYTYNWVYQSTAGILSLVQLTNVSTTTVGVSGIAGADGTASGVLTCMVKDSNGRVTFASVSVSLTFSNPGGGGPD